MTIVTGQNGKASDFINESEADATPANNEGKVPKLESDGKFSGFFLRAPSVQVFTSSGTWNKPAGLRYVIVELVGGGAGGEGDGSESSDFSGDGGGAGGYARKLIPVGDLGASETVTIGAGGASDWGAGGASSFGSHCSANGGTQNVGGTATGGDINIQGQYGADGFTDAGPSGNSIGKPAGHGGDSMFGFGGRPNQTNRNATGYGAGGAGGWGGGSFDAGGTGAPGIVIVHEFF